MQTLDRRRLLGQSLAGLGVLSLSPSLLGMSSSAPIVDYRDLKAIGPLGKANQDGIRLPEGFSSRTIAKAGERVLLADGTRADYRWHTFPDGGACFDTPDGGWIYVSNSEVPLSGGGVGAIRFDAQGDIRDAYSLLQRTSMNCAGGATPWGSWLSCEEVNFGRVFECDPYGESEASVCPGLGNFKHEAAAVDLKYNQIYLTEDEPDGCLYRFTPYSIDQTGKMNLTDGVLEVACWKSDTRVEWKLLDNPNPSGFATPTRKQVKEAIKFDGGEGIWYHEGLIYFSTKGDNRIWKLDTLSQELSTTYDASNFAEPILKGVDNICVSKDGHILVAEDGDDMQIVVIGPYGDVYPLLQVTGQDHSEITGPFLHARSNRLYFSSQRGPNFLSRGLSFEVSGPFKR